MSSRLVEGATLRIARARDRQERLRLRTAAELPLAPMPRVRFACCWHAHARPVLESRQSAENSAFWAGGREMANLDRPLTYRESSSTLGRAGWLRTPSRGPTRCLRR
eukprot:6206054-Pleurochrysis_carterae.AAC.1